MTNLAKIEPKNIADQVYNRVVDMSNAGNLDLPANYSAGNALKSAYLILQETKTRDKKPVLQACSQESIANTLLDMVTQGLNPAKQQCYFIPYGNKLTLSRSYLGTVAITKRIPGVKDVKGYPVYKDDNFKLGFDYITGKTTVESYNPGLNRDPKNLIGAFAIIIGQEEILHTEYMDMSQIRRAWNQGQMKGNSGAHNNFTDQMAIKTVINRACKLYANTADDSDKVVNILNSGDVQRVDSEFEQEKLENANSQELPVYEDIIEGDFEEVQEDLQPGEVSQETGEVGLIDEEKAEIEAMEREQADQLDLNSAPF